uniref:hypothetical protein n=1 Tax=Streptomyces scabiei TaxID=1930 RepID=UPI001969303A
MLHVQQQHPSVPPRPRAASSEGVGGLHRTASRRTTPYAGSPAPAASMAYAPEWDPGGAPAADP